jgi:NADH:ubiquinone reductase (H+-translocating)
MRRLVTGMLAGLAGAAVLAATVGSIATALVAGTVAGGIYALAFARPPRASVDGLMTGATLGVPLWAVLEVIVIPLLQGRTPQWTGEGMRSLMPELAGWVLSGAAIGGLFPLLNGLASRVLGPERRTDRTPQASTPPKHILILGGGFGGMTTAQNLERVFGADPSVRFTLISENNALLFTPMLSEVAGSSLEPTHISSPLRTSLKRTQVVRGRIESVDLEQRRVVVAMEKRGGAGVDREEFAYDHLVFALGAVSNYLGLTNVKKVAFDFKSLMDAIRIRNHVIDMFEHADRETNPERRRALLTFVVAGGGFAGVELAGALNDFARGMLADYPRLRSEDLHVVLVHSRDRILPELSHPLASYALERMSQRGVEFRLNARLVDARRGAVLLKPEEEIAAETLVWTAGTAPNPLLKTLALPLDKRGAVVVEPTLSVAGSPGVWAIGDCAAVNDARTGKPCPPTAQFALREARVLARNIKAQLDARPLQGFHFDSLGALCVVGHQTACAELTIPFARQRSVRFSGLVAWLMWRAIYVGKLPGMERKIRVLMDWTIELFFPRDIVQTIDLHEAAQPAETAREAVDAMAVQS